MLCNPCGNYFAKRGTLPNQEILAERNCKGTEPTKKKLSGPCSHCPAVGTYPTTNQHHVFLFRRARFEFLFISV